jgi:hypothetical protein
MNNRISVVSMVHSSVMHQEALNSARPQVGYCGQGPAFKMDNMGLTISQSDTI